MDPQEEIQNKLANLEDRMKHAEFELNILKRASYLEMRGQTSAILITFMLIGLGLTLAFAVHFDWVK
jgi:hypothetical protein